MDIPDTKERILKAAEQLFGEQGFAGTSLRAVTAAAGVNLAAVNYHFHSKEALFQAVAQYCMRSMSDERLQRLDALQASGLEMSLEALLEAYLAPIFEELARAGEQASPLLRFLMQTLNDPNPQLQQMVAASAQKTLARYLPAFAEALPQLSPQELLWRFRMLNTVVLATAAGLAPALLADAAMPTTLPPGVINPAWLMTFLLAALRAPATAEPPAAL